MISRIFIITGLDALDAGRKNSTKQSGVIQKKKNLANAHRADFLHTESAVYLRTRNDNQKALVEHIPGEMFGRENRKQKLADDKEAFVGNSYVLIQDHGKPETAIS